MSASEVLDKLREATPDELRLVRETADSLLAMLTLGNRETAEIHEAIAESEAQFARGEGIPLLCIGGVRS